jgi:hypothetical protein
MQEDTSNATTKQTKEIFMVVSVLILNSCEYTFLLSNVCINFLVHPMVIVGCICFGQLSTALLKSQFPSLLAITAVGANKKVRTLFSYPLPF